jgi:hypothetical protein
VIDEVMSRLGEVGVLVGHEGDGHERGAPVLGNEPGLRGIDSVSTTDAAPGAPSSSAISARSPLGSSAIGASWR